MKTSNHIVAISLVFMLSFAFSAFAQDAKTSKKELSAASKFAKNDQHKEAIESYTKAISADAKNADAFIGRATSYEKSGKLELAVADYRSVFNLLQPGDKQLKELYYKTGADLVTMQQYKDAQAMFDKAIAMDNSYLLALQQRALCKIKLKDFAGSIEDCDKAIAEDKSNHLTIFYKAVSADSLASYQLSEMLYQKAIGYMMDQKSKNESIDKKHKPYFINLSIVQRKLNKLDDALKSINSAMNIDQNDDHVYYQRGLLYFLKTDYNTAITDFTKAIVINDKNFRAFTERGYTNKKLGQFQNAITDFTRAIILNENEQRSYTGRGGSYFEIGKYTESLKDLEMAAKLAPKDADAQKLLADTKQKIYDINRESNIPEIVITAPENNNKNQVNIPDNVNEITLKGKIKDESGIKSITIDNVAATYDKEALQPTFTAVVQVSNKQQITINATDIYNNAGVEIYSLIQTETLAPVVKLTSPRATPDGEIYLSSDNPNIFVEGEITDASNIQSITVDGLVAAFNPGELNPKFSTNLNILNKDSIKIIATDVYGNAGVFNYFIDREASAAALTNPMGRTWAVFIDNTNYQNLNSLQGTTADVTKMRGALAAYRIDKTIVKKDMSKKDMEKFFSIELRDMLRDNQINSVMIWYSGHGKFMNDVGYWIPVDAVKEDEFTYYSLNNLKASLLGYKDIKHHLVISDACETGPAFYLAMRDSDKPKECGEWDYAKYKSAQVLTSSNTEKSADNSIFATTFSTSLSTNTDQCVSIENIAEKVKAVVKKNQAQTPKFGNISGIEDAGGTFFFIKK